MTKDLRGYYYAKINKSLNYLEFTYQRVKNLSTDFETLSPEQLEIWDSFSTRFARSSELFLMKYIKAAIKTDDPAFDGSFRDYLNRAEKLNLIESVLIWHEIRDLRNVTVHEYSEDDLKKLLGKMLVYTPLLLELRKKLADAT